MIARFRLVALAVCLALVSCNPLGDSFNPLAPPEGSAWEDPAHPRSNDPTCFEGFVRSAANDLPVPDATVGAIGRHTLATRTNQQGYYSIRCAPHHGIESLRARKEGWRSQHIRLHSLADDGTRPRRIDFSLEPISLSTIPVNAR